MSNSFSSECRSGVEGHFQRQFKKLNERKSSFFTSHPACALLPDPETIQSSNGKEIICEEPSCIVLIGVCNNVG